MIRKLLLAVVAIIALNTSGFAANKTSAKTSVGVVNFTRCMSESKLGKQEQSSFEALKTQMTSLLEDTEKQINEINTKFSDPEYMDGLSPEAEEELKNKFRTLSEEMNRYQNQYYQVLNQANMRIVQTMGANIQEASEKVANQHSLAMVINKEACFFFTKGQDVTSLVIAELDRNFDQKNAKSQTAGNVQTPSAK